MSDAMRESLKSETRLTIAVVLLLGSIFFNWLQWRNAEDLRELAGAACQTVMADDGRCTRYSLGSP